MDKYIYELPDWPGFKWDFASIAETLAAVRYRQGQLIGRMSSLGFDLRQEAELTALTQEILKSSEIEGELLDHEQVRSSIARRLGIDIGALSPVDRNVEGVVEMMLNATNNFESPVTTERLFAWHASLFPTGYSGMQRIKAGVWRDDEKGPMQVVSGPIGRERVHYQAPPASALNREIEQFLIWINSSPIDPVLKAALAHLWFVVIHPFEDGNGRIARALSDMMLARSEQTSQRFYSMSEQIRVERKDYYDILEKTSKGTLEITSWLRWFLDCLTRAINGAENLLDAVLSKSRFWELDRDKTFNDRQ